MYFTTLVTTTPLGWLAEVGFLFNWNGVFGGPFWLLQGRMIVFIAITIVILFNTNTHTNLAVALLLPVVPQLEMCAMFFAQLSNY
jgi:hypothetical protein